MRPPGTRLAGVAAPARVAARTGLAVFAVALALAAPAAAHADPLTLRLPAPPSRGATVALGAPSLSAGGWLTPHLGVAVAWRLPAVSMEAALAWRAVLLGGARGFGVDGVADGGLVVPALTLGAALEVGGSVRGRWRGDWLDLGLGISGAVAAGWAGGFGVRAPLRLEPSVALTFGRLSVGLVGGAGLTFVAGLHPAWALEGAVFAAWKI